MKVAFTTSSGVRIDGSFRNANDFTIWDITRTETNYVSTVSIIKDPQTADDRIRIRADALAGCALLCTNEINGPANARLNARNIRVLKFIRRTSVEEIIVNLQEALQGTPPAWMKKTANSSVLD